MEAYPAALLAVIAAPDAAAKQLALAAVPLPAEGAQWAHSHLPGHLPERPGRPAHYVESTVAPKRRRTLAHEASRQRFLLAIHHIELTAIDLACAAALAGSGMPIAFHADQLAVAQDEAIHAQLIGGLLTERGWPPGCEPVHHRLWDAARACQDLGDILVVIPRFLEARGLDVSADLLPRLASIDPEAHAVIQRIYTDEITHVTIGTRWHRYWCATHGEDPEIHFRRVATHHFSTQIPGPFALDQAGRTQAGFTAGELSFLSSPRNTF